MSITRIPVKSKDDLLALHRKYIGGSEAAAIVGLNAFTTKFELFMEKTGRAEPFTGNRATRMGEYLEDFVAKEFALWWEQEKGKKPVIRNPRMAFYNSDYPWAVANIDRELPSENAGLEIKTALSGLSFKRFRGGNYPANYYCQCVHYLAVTGRPCWYIAALTNSSETGLKVFRVERDEDEIRTLMEAEREFYEEHLQKDIPPEPDGEPATDDAIKTLYPQATDDSVLDMTVQEELIRLYLEIQAGIKEKESDLNRVKQELQLALGTRERGQAGNYRVSWTNAVRTTFDSKALMRDNPNVSFAKYQKPSAYRTFSVKEIVLKDKETES